MKVNILVCVKQVPKEERLSSFDPVTENAYPFSGDRSDKRV